MIAALDKRAPTPPLLSAVPSAATFDPSAALRWNLDAVKADVARKIGWTDDFVAQVESEYRKFILVSARHPERHLPMGGAVDEFWHHHILDTKDYCDFCLAVAGRYIHHCPGRGAPGQGTIRQTMDLIARSVGAIDEAVWLAAGTLNARCGADPCSSCDKLAN